MPNKLSAEGDKIVSAIRIDIEKLRSDFLQIIEQKDRQISSMNSEVQLLRKEVLKLREEVDDSEAYERRDTLVLSGSEVPVCTNGELVSNICCDLVRDKLRIQLNPTDISTSHRIGKKPASQTPDRRNIIMKLCRRDLKSSLLDACRSNKPSNFYVNESLTPVRSKVMYALRKMKKETGSRVSGTSTRDGRVFAWVKHAPGSPPGSRDVKVPVNSLPALQEFSLKYMAKDASYFIDVSSF